MLNFSIFSFKLQAMFSKQYKVKGTKEKEILGSTAGTLLSQLATLVPCINSTLPT